MAKTIKRLLILVCAIAGTNAQAQAAVHTVEIMLQDEITMHADYYAAASGNEKPLIILCHQAGYSKGEYKEIAPVLNEMGFDCIAIDMRSGGSVNGIDNETARQAQKRKLSTDYESALSDIESVADFYINQQSRKIILWGSSYSAGLIFPVAKSHEEVLACIAFSPGEYFKNPNYLRETLLDFNKPIFATAAREEIKPVMELFGELQSATVYTPNSAGQHGSSTLWQSTEGNNEYWDALRAFFTQHKFI